MTEPVTSESELEEGEIINDDVEIITEIIRSAPVRRPKPLPCSPKTVDRSTATNLKKLPSPATPYPLGNYEKSNRSNRTNQHAGSETCQSRPKSSRPAHTSNSTSTSKAWPKSSNTKTAAPDRAKPKQSKPVSRPAANNSNRKPESRSQTRSTPNKRKYPSDTGPVEPPASEKKTTGPTAELSPHSSSENKWKNTFEVVSNISVDSNMSLASEEEDAEEMELRLAALESVVTNAKPKEAQPDLSEISIPTQGLPNPAADQVININPIYTNMFIHLMVFLI